jgi:hypothetical protein
MRFEELKISDYVKFNKSLKQQYFRIKNHERWQNEPTNCVLEVRYVDLGHTIASLECVQDCGGHNNLSFMKTEYNKISEELKGELLVKSSFSEIFIIPEASKIPYILTVEDNIEYINKLLDKMVE